MKLTPLDIHHKEFRRALRGYNEEEVDVFLDEVADEFERIFKENVELREELEQLQGKMDQYENLEQTLHNTLLTAQKSAEELQWNAKKEADLVVKDAEFKAKQMVEEAHNQRRLLTSALSSLKAIEEEFRSKFKSMLESYLARVAEVEQDEKELARRTAEEVQKLSQREEKGRGAIFEKEEKKEKEEKEEKEEKKIAFEREKKERGREEAKEEVKEEIEEIKRKQVEETPQFEEEIAVFEEPEELEREETLEEEMPKVPKEKEEVPEADFLKPESSDSRKVSRKLKKEEIEEIS